MPVLVFDLNETLLDLRGLDPEFERLFGDARVRGEWFRQTLQSAMTLTITGDYRDFTEVGAAALHMVGRKHGVAVADAEVQAVAGALRSLPSHPDAEEALATLRERGHRLAVLTNSPARALQEQLANSGLERFFEASLSVEELGVLKPAPSVYRGAAARLGASSGDMWMIAAHGWDLVGAMNAGCRTAFVARPGQVPEALFPEPDIQCPDLRELANRLGYPPGSGDHSGSG